MSSDSGKANPIFRAPTAAAPTSMPQRHSVEERMFNDILRMPRSDPPRASEEPKGRGEESLTITLLRKIQDLETKNRELTQLLVTKDREILHLKHESASDGIGPEKIALLAENTVLKKTLQEMESFLQDYGLVWVGAQQPASAAPEKLPAKPVVDIDFSILFLRLRQLNELVGAGKAQVVNKDGVHKFEVLAGTPLTIYSNGFMLNRGPFRHFADPLSKPFLQDIMDGYFPAELQGMYPKGTAFEVIDKSSEDYVTASPKVAPDSRAGGAINSLASVGSAEFSMSIPEFISALPTVKVADGAIVNVRSEIASLLKPDSDVAKVQVPVDETHVGPMTTLQVRSADGKQTLVIKMPYSATVAQLHELVETRRAVATAFELKAGFPPRPLEDTAITLEAAKLVPSAIVYVKDLK